MIHGIAAHTSISQKQMIDKPASDVFNGSMPPLEGKHRVLMNKNMCARCYSYEMTDHHSNNLYKNYRNQLVAQLMTLIVYIVFQPKMIAL